MVMKKEAVLLLGELGSATKAEDPSMYDGLAYVLRERKSSTSFTGMVVDGGLIPRLPEYYGVSNAEEMHFLGTNPAKEDSEKVRELKSRLGEIKVQHLKKKYGEFKCDTEFLTAIDSLGQKIITKSEAAQVAKGNLKKVISALGIGVPLHYIEGDEDKKNKKELKELKIVNYKANKDTNSKLEEKIGEREKRLDVVEDIVTALDTLKGAELKKLDIEARDVKNKLKEYLDTPEKLPDNIEKIADKLNGNGKGIAASKINELRHLDEEIEKLKGELRDYEINDLAMLREKEASSFFRITKRRALTAQDEEVLSRLAHYEYRETLRSVGQFDIHEEKQVRLKLGNLNVVVGHNQLGNSDSPNKNIFKKMIESHDSREEEQADLVVDGHNGPLKATVEKKDIFDDDVMMYLQIPTFQSEEKLKECLNSGIKNVHTKRLSSGNFGSGATIISKSDDGTLEMEFYDDRQLIAIGRKASEVNELKRQLGKGRDEALEKRIAEAERELKSAAAYDYTQFIHTTDSHIGIRNSIESVEDFRKRLDEYASLKETLARTKEEKVKARLLNVTHQLVFGETPSSIELTKRVLKYIEDKVKIDKKTEWVITGDEVNGSSYRGANTEYGVTSVGAERYVRAIKESGLNPEEKDAFEKALWKRITDSTPVTNLSKQWDIYREIKIPHLNAARRKGATINVAGGNHFSNSVSDGQFNEAIEIVSRLEDIDGSHKTRVRYSEEGGSEGSELWWEKNGALFFAGHKPTGGGDFPQRMMDHFDRPPKGLVAAFFGHYHRHAVAFKDGILYGMAPGENTGGHYCDLTGIGYSPHGAGISKIDPEKPGHFVWTIVSDNPLKKYAGLPIDPVKMAKS